MNDTNRSLNAIAELAGLHVSENASARGRYSVSDNDRRLIADDVSAETARAMIERYVDPGL